MLLVVQHVHRTTFSFVSIDQVQDNTVNRCLQIMSR